MRRVLAEMAAERGVTFTPPATTAEGRREFDRLKKIPRLSGAERRDEARAIKRAVDSLGDSASVQRREIAGYGSTATWSERG